MLGKTASIPFVHFCNVQRITSFFIYVLTRDSDIFELILDVFDSVLFFQSGQLYIYKKKKKKRL